MVTNVTEIQVPNGSLTDLGGGKVLLTMQAGSGSSGSGGLENPMLAAGDLIVGGAAALVNQALISLGATASSPDPVYQSNVPLYAIDGDANTGWLASTTATTTLTVDLGQPRNISAYRVVQTSEGHKRSYIIESSDDQQTWATRVTSLPNPLLNSGVVALTATVLARYWRMTLIGPSANTSYGSGLQTFELHNGAIAGAPTRLAGGSFGTVLTMVNGKPTWSAPAGAASLLFSGDGTTTTFLLPDVQAAGLTVTILNADGSSTQLLPTEFGTIQSRSADLCYAQRNTATASINPGSASAAFDNNLATSWGMSYNYGGNWLQIDLGAAKNVIGAKMVGNDWDSSGISIRASNAADFASGYVEVYRGRLQTDTAWASAGSYRYWRTYYWSGGGNSMMTWELYEAVGSTLSGVVLTTAPVTGSKVIVQYAVASGGGDSTQEAAGGKLYLFDTYY